MECTAGLLCHERAKLSVMKPPRHVLVPQMSNSNQIVVVQFALLDSGGPSSGFCFLDAVTCILNAKETSNHRMPPKYLD